MYILFSPPGYLYPSALLFFDSSFYIIQFELQIQFVGSGTLLFYLNIFLFLILICCITPLGL